RNDHSERVSDEDRAWSELHLNELEVVAAGFLEEDIEEEPGSADARGDADDAGEERVGHAFGEEGLDEVAALSADGTGDTHFGAPFGGEHDEDHEDEHHASGHREEAEH